MKKNCARFICNSSIETGMSGVSSKVGETNSVTLWSRDSMLKHVIGANVKGSVTAASCNKLKLCVIRCHSLQNP